MNDETIFDYAQRWKKRKNAGDTQVAIARDEGVSESQVSRVLKFGKLPSVEHNRCHNMFHNGEITEGAILDLVDSGDPEKRRMVLELAIQHCKIRDADAESDKRTGRKGRSTDNGKVTVDEIRSAIKELKELGGKKANRTLL